MTKPREKTREELQAEIEDGKKKIRQFENREKMLRQMYGENRIDDFIKLCMMRGWIVNRIDVENQIDIYNKAEEEIEL